MGYPSKHEVYFGALNLSPYFTERRPSDWVGIDFVFAGLPKKLLSDIRLLIDTRTLIYFSITGGEKCESVLIQSRFVIDWESVAFASENGIKVFTFEGASDE